MCLYYWKESCSAALYEIHVQKSVLMEISKRSATVNLMLFD